VRGAHAQIEAVALLPRIGDVVADATSCDAASIALAERLEATVITADAKRERIPGVRCEVRPLRPA
jgi:predicted nucleic acid-binding protein